MVYIRMKYQINEEKEIQLYKDALYGAMQLDDKLRNEGWTFQKLDELAYDIYYLVRKEHVDMMQAAKKRYELKHLGYEECVGVTFNLPENYTNIEIKEVISLMINWRNKVIEGSIMRPEFFGRSGKWNPHLHLWVPLPKGRTEGKLRQALKRKFKDKWNINYQKGHSNTLNYVKGIKQDSKEDAMQLDENYRILHNYEETYQL